MIIAYNITDRTISFFAKGRPWSISSSHPNFDQVKTLITVGPETPADLSADAKADLEKLWLDALISLVDPRASIKARSGGKLEFNDADQLVYNGAVLHNVWADKIIAFKREGIPYDPVFKALENLQTNPTPEAIERLPIFLERVQSGFLPDGRCTAFKGVRSDYKDQHTGTFDNSVGKVVKIDRSACDANPDNECSSGLHVGALEYLKQFYFNPNNKVVFVAYWPHDVVAVPKDYNGTKMRVCEYEVLADVDKNFVGDFLAGRTTRVDGYTSTPTAPTPKEEDNREKAFNTLTVGDWIETDDYHAVEVIALRLGTDEPYVIIRDDDGDASVIYCDDDHDDQFERKVDTPPVAEQLTHGCRARIEGHPFLRDGWFDVEETNDGYDGVVLSTDDAEEFTVRQEYIVEVKHKDIDLTNA